MSRNPVLSDAAFGGTSTTERPSPADEWRNAQAAGTTTAAARTLRSPRPARRRSPPSPPGGP